MGTYRKMRPLQLLNMGVAVLSSALVVGLRERVDSILGRCFSQMRSRHKLA